MAAGYATALRNAQNDAISTYVGTSAVFKIYSGTQPATGGTAGTTLATFTMSASAFAPASSAGVLTVNLPADVNASATGTASWGRLFKSDGTTICIDVSVGTSGTQVILNSTTITSGVACSITSWTITNGMP
jgi:hypothetical protein